VLHETFSFRWLKHNTNRQLKNKLGTLFVGIFIALLMPSSSKIPTTHTSDRPMIHGEGIFYLNVEGRGDDCSKLQVMELYFKGGNG